MSVSAVDETWYQIRLEWDGMILVVKDRYSNLEKLYSRLTERVPKDIKPAFPPKLLIHSATKLTERRYALQQCLAYLFSRIDDRDLFDYLVRTGLSEQDFLKVARYIKMHPWITFDRWKKPERERMQRLIEEPTLIGCQNERLVGKAPTVKN